MLTLTFDGVAGLVCYVAGWFALSLAVWAFWHSRRRRGRAERYIGLGGAAIIVHGPFASADMRTAKDVVHQGMSRPTVDVAPGNCLVTSALLDRYLFPLRVAAFALVLIGSCALVLVLHAIHRL